LQAFDLLTLTFDFTHMRFKFFVRAAARSSVVNGMEKVGRLPKRGNQRNQNKNQIFHVAIN
jgi:hypothetical protein